MLRAAYSERQLQEVLTDFWFNHFNVDARKGPDRFMLTEYERDTIRPHVLGKFRDLLEATAKSPAMLFYLDNWMSADPNGPHPDDLQMRPRRSPAAWLAAGRDRGPPPPPAAPRRRTRSRTSPEGPQRKLRPRADGAAHARRRRRLHAEGRHRSRARVHGLDDSESARWAAASCSSRDARSTDRRSCSDT